MTQLLAQGIPFADAWSMHDGDVGFGWWLVMTIGMIAFLGAIIAVVVWLLRGGAVASRRRESVQKEPSPTEILDRRLADSSLSVEEYERRRRLLTESDPDALEAREPTVGADR